MYITLLASPIVADKGYNVNVLTAGFCIIRLQATFWKILNCLIGVDVQSLNCGPDVECKGLVDVSAKKNAFCSDCWDQHCIQYCHAISLLWSHGGTSISGSRLWGRFGTGRQYYLYPHLHLRIYGQRMPDGDASLMVSEGKLCSFAFRSEILSF